MNNFNELGKKYNTDKVYAHHYDEIYDFYLKEFYEKNGAILEIGIFKGASLNMYLELFKNAYVYGIDINCEENNERYNIFKGDQSNELQLNNIKQNIINENKNIFYINDDGSHIPEHQLLSFNVLFPLLVPGGIYIIEDIGTSYLSEGDCYGYPLNYGLKNKNNIAEIFKDTIDTINCQNTSCKVKHSNLIGSIIFGRSCIIIKKKVTDFF
jgi:uncharacterized protein (UPF0248 family)